MRLHHSLLAAAETIRFQPNSSLAAKLVTHCQKAIDWVNNTREITGGKNAGVIAAGVGRIRPIVRYLKGNWASDLEELILTELNLKAKLRIHGSLTPNAAIRWKVDSTADEFDIQYSQVSGMNRQQNYVDTLNAVARQIGDGANPDTGRLNKYAHEHFSIELYVMSGLFTMPEAYFIEPNTVRGEHIAAVIAHELGHAVTVATGLSSVHQRIDLVRDSITYAQRHHTDATLDNDLRAGLNALNALPSKGPHVDAATTAGNVVLKTGGMSEKRTMLIIVDDFITQTIIALIWKQFLTANMAGAGGTKKTSDILVTEHNITFNERNADLFVSRHGMSGALSEMMAIMHSVEERGLKRNVITNFMAATPVLTQILTLSSALRMAVSAVSGVGAATITEYDPIIQRLEYITKNSYGIFKDPDLPPNIISEMLTMTDRAKAAANTYNSQTYVKVRHFLWATLMRLGKAHSLVAAMTDANLRSDFAKLQAMTGDLVNNSLYYQSARLRHM